MWTVLELKRTKTCSPAKPGAHEFCVICMEDPFAKNNETSQLQCGHTFCTECIDQVICFAKKRAKCPLCRKSLVKLWTVEKKTGVRRLSTTLVSLVVCLILAIILSKFSHC